MLKSSYISTLLILFSALVIIPIMSCVSMTTWNYQPNNIYSSADKNLTVLNPVFPIEIYLSDIKITQDTILSSGSNGLQFHCFSFGESLKASIQQKLQNRHLFRKVRLEKESIKLQTSNYIVMESTLSNLSSSWDGNALQWIKSADFEARIFIMPEKRLIKTYNVHQIAKSPTNVWSINKEFTKKHANDTFNKLRDGLSSEIAQKLESSVRIANLFEKNDIPTSNFSIQNQSKSTQSHNTARREGACWAVIVGLSKYKYSGRSGLTNLVFADDDALAFANTLKKIGWSDSHLKVLINEKATHRNIMIALESWLTKAKTNDQIILFWAGHGYPDPGNPEKVYFACYDTDISIPATGYRMDNVRRSLEEKQSKNVILLADTCHAGKLITRGQSQRSIVPQIRKYQKEKNIPKGWVFMVGADTDRQAIEHSSWSNGAFTHSLVKGLDGDADGYQSAGIKDGIITMGELKEYMKTSMPDETQRVLGVAKHPIITTSSGDPDIWNLTLQMNR